jgi:nucleoid-associated protein YgaU
MPLQRAAFVRLKPDLVEEAGRMVIQFNPKELSFSKGVQYAEIGIPGLDLPLQQFVRGQAETLDVNLFFDTTEHGMGEERSVRPVTLLTDQFYQLIRIDGETGAPPVCRFTWGEIGFPGSNLSGSWGSESNWGRKNGFQGIVESVSQNFTLFSPLGVPLRATLAVRMREYLTLAQAVSVLSERVRIVDQNQTLDQIASRAYNDPSKWREIADFNNISDPLSLAAGTALGLPP